MFETVARHEEIKDCMLHRPAATADEATAPLPILDAAAPAAVPDTLPPAVVPDAPRGTEKRSRTRVRHLRACKPKRESWASTRLPELSPPTPLPLIQGKRKRQQAALSPDRLR